MKHATPVSILKTATPTGSSKKQLIRELLGLLSTEKDVLWRSSPALFDSGKSESGSRGRTRYQRQSSVERSQVSNTPTHSTMSGIDYLDSSQDWEDSDFEFSPSPSPHKMTGRRGGTPPPDSPPDNEAIYDMLRELDTKREINLV
ncbi:ORF3 [Grizzly bear anellovirus 4]|nr:ORF3 [Grizzly bear anellovirus 4]